MKAFFHAFIDHRRTRFYRWVDKRTSAKKTHTLTQKNLFIFPTRQGFTFLLIALVLWVLGTNYQNNLILALVFFMVALLVVAIHTTFFNMSKVQVEFLESKEAFAGDTFQCRFLFRVDRGSWAEAIRFRWQGFHDVGVELSIEPNLKTKEINLAFYADKRGELRLPRLGVESTYPFGLVRCWTWLNLDKIALVYPKPKTGRLNSGVIEDSDGDGLHPVRGSDDFSGLKDYVSGDNLRNIAWKALARGQGLFVKDFSQSLSSEHWLDFDSVAANNQEDKLSILCFWVLEHYQQNESFGLILPGLKIEPNSGYEHREHCLTALARFQGGANR